MKRAESEASFFHHATVLPTNATTATIDLNVSSSLSNSLTSSSAAAASSISSKSYEETPSSISVNGINRSNGNGHKRTPSSSVKQALSDPVLKDALNTNNNGEGVFIVDEEEMMKKAAKVKFEKLVRRYYYQLVHGCRDLSCRHKLCASNKSGPRLTNDAAAIMAIQLASRYQKKHMFCSGIPEDVDEILEQTESIRKSVGGALSSPGSDHGDAPLSTSDADSNRPKPFLYSLLGSTPFASIFGGSEKAEAAAKPTTPSPASSSSSPNPSGRRLSKKEHTGYLVQTAFRNSPAAAETSKENATKVSEGSSISINNSAPLKRNLFSSLTNTWRTKSSMDLPSLISSSSVRRTPQRLQETNDTFTVSRTKVVTRCQSNGSLPSTMSVTDLSMSFDASVSILDEVSTATDLDYEATENDTQEATTILSRLRNTEAKLTLQYLNLTLLKSMMATLSDDSEFFINTIQKIFSSPDDLNRSFLVSNSNGTAPHHPSHLDIPSIREAYDTILNASVSSSTDAQANAKFREKIVSTLANAIELCLAKLELNPKKLIDELPKSVRCLIILLENPLLEDKSFHDSLVKRFCKIFGNLKTKAKVVLIKWLSKYAPNDLTRLIKMFQTFLDDHFVPSMNNTGSDTSGAALSAESSVVDCVKVLSVFYHANEAAKPSRLIPISTFYNDTISRKLNFKEEYRHWRKTLDSRPITLFSFFNYPFLLDPVSKTRILHIDAMVKMSLEFEDAFVNQALVIHAQRFLPESQTVVTMEKEMKAKTNPYLVLEIRRQELVKDTLEQIRKKEMDLKKPLKVKFVGGGEEGMDQGGVQKEFFQILVNQLVDPAYGMFTYDTETRYVWINGHSLESERHFELVGIVIGMALYNGVILGINFPKLMYKKLVDEKIDLEDIKDAFPALGKGLQMLLDWSDGDVADIYMRTFVIEYDVYGAIKTFPLCDGGDDILVTNENRQEYVNLYIKHLVNQSVERQFNAFRRGFWKVVGGKALKMCRSEELELLLCGSTELDFAELEEGAEYDDGYGTEHPLMKHLWEIVHDMSLDQKRKFLMFVTASDRIPLKGLGNVMFVVQRNGPDTERLPTALTCFGRLLLPEYSSKEKLKEKLLTAIENAKGFGLV